MYRYDFDLTQLFRFVGAENNKMLILEDRNDLEKTLGQVVQSRFQFTWESTSSLRAVVFDLDGVLVDSMKYYLEAWRKAFTEADVMFDADDFGREIYLREGEKREVTAKELYTKYVGMPPQRDIEQRIIEHKANVYRTLIDHILPIPGAKDLLAFLKKNGVPMALVTGGSRETAAILVRRLFEGYFEVVVTGDDVSNGKPDAMPYRLAIEKLGVLNYSHCVAVENSPLGTEAAKRAGVVTFGILHDSPLKPEDLERRGARKVFKSHGELVDALGQLRFTDFFRLDRQQVPG